MANNNNNPFASLIQNDTVASDFKQEERLSNVLEEIFGFTLKQGSKDFLYLESFSDETDNCDLSLDILDQVLFDRLFLCSDENVLKKSYNKTPSFVYENHVTEYLYSVYVNANHSVDLTDSQKTSVLAIIIRNLITALKQPDIYVNQDLFAQLYEILKKESLYYDAFFQDILQGLLNGERNDITDVLSPLYELMKKKVLESDLITLDYDVFNVLSLFTSNETVASVFTSLLFPAKPDIGIEYTNTVLGGLFNLSVTPKTPNGRYEYFLSPLEHGANRIAENNLWINIDKLNDHIYGIVLKMLKCSPSIKDKTLKWLGSCLKANTDRGKLWNAHTPAELNPASYSTVTDGFMINFTNVLLRFCQPFCTKEKIMKVDPTYCSVPAEQLQEKKIHLAGMSDETCLIPCESEEKRLSANNYSFITECFYLAHRSIDLGYRVSYEKMIQLNQEIGRIDRTYNDAIRQSTSSNDLVNILKDKMTSEMTKYLCQKTQLLEPVLVTMLFDFISVTSHWLSQVSVHFPVNDGSYTLFASKAELNIKFPIPDQIPNALKCIPEFIVENIVHFLVCQRRFNPDAFEIASYDKMHPILTFIIIFMGSNGRIKNPHIRAHLAEALESLLPLHKDQTDGLCKLGNFQREMIFMKHEHRSQIVQSLLEVFVGIEMTGESVEFEQKFNYRRPMYMIMDYLWDKEEYEVCFRSLALDAEKNIEAVTPPLFLKFINLLLNDAVFLLDESFTNMAKLKDMQLARENGEWENLPATERAQNISYLHHVGMIARFDNILGRETIKALERLTSKITIVFTHSTMVDRVAAMLNYFLLNLVGPNKKNFKVKDQKEYHFDPAGMVIDICKIYINLKESDAFCLAVSQDGRSYNHQLFTLAEDVLIRIGGGSLIGELKEVANKVVKKAEEYQTAEENITDIPEHFLDPIMSTMMTDPVILPSSRQIVDRNTIARHLLSDQTDPFNRAPLTMDQIIPHTELAEEIRLWKAEKCKNSST